MNIRKIHRTLKSASAFWVALFLLGLSGREACSQDRYRSLAIKWLCVNDLQSTFAIEGAEVEMHRTGNLPEQNDGLRWPALFQYQDCWAAKAMWIGTTNFLDPVKGITYPYKVVGAGTAIANPKTEIMPVPGAFRMIGRFYSPRVTVDGLEASDMKLQDIVDEIDTDLPADRMIINQLHTTIGITLTRKLMSFSQQNHGNYFIYEYIFKNTGIIDLKGTRIERTLTDCAFHFWLRYAIANEGFKKNWYPAASVSWGKNTVNHTVGMDPMAADFEFRAQYAWYGPFSSATWDDWGAPDNKVSGTLGAARMAGTVTLHADKSASDPSDDLYQPQCTRFILSDSPMKISNQYDAQSMAKKYTEYMVAPHPEKTHAELVGDNFADTWTTDAGGVSAGQGFGPYTLAPGDSVRLVFAEAVGGLCREKNLEVGGNWFNNRSPFTMPDGSVSTDKDAYKKAWVLTAKDSLFKAFRRAIETYNKGYVIPQPPPPPEWFNVESAGDKIGLSWADNAVQADHFDGYEIWRAVNKPDTFYQKIFSCNASNAVHTFDDTTADRGYKYYYYVVTKDDGSQNDYQPGVPLVSSKFFTKTNEPAYLRRQAKENLESIRIVPNPYHIKAQKLQFGTDSPDQIAFFGLPAVCTIRIFTERGELIRTLDHKNNSGDELWDSTTDYKQVIVSGLYVAVFETPDGEVAYRKFIVIR
jgi:hypothetical protein